VAALTPQAEIEGDMGDAHMGLQARLMSQALRKLTATIGKSRTVLIFINQIRMKIGMMFGNPETTTGGNALKFYASVRLDVRKFETIEGSGDDDAVGTRVRVKVAKNKVAPPFRKAELEIIFGKGISAIASLLDAGVKYNIIEKKGAWFSYGEEKIGQGRENAKAYLENNPDFAAEVEQKLRKIMFPGRDPAPKDQAKPAAPQPEEAPETAAPLAETADSGAPAPAAADPVPAAPAATPAPTPAAPAPAAPAPGTGLAAAAAAAQAKVPAGKSPPEPPPAPRGRGRPPLNRQATISLGQKPGKGDDGLF
jgi:recombination protein RecA